MILDAYVRALSSTRTGAAASAASAAADSATSPIKGTAKMTAAKMMAAAAADSEEARAARSRARAASAAPASDHHRMRRRQQRRRGGCRRCLRCGIGIWSGRLWQRWQLAGKGRGVRGAALRRTNMSTLSRKTWTSGPLHRSLHRHCRAQPGAWQWRPPPHAEGRRKRRAPRIDIDNADSGGKVHQTIVKRPRMSRDGDWLWRRRRLEWGRRAPLVWCAHGAGQRPNLSPDAGPYRRPVRTCQRNSPSPTWRKSPSLHCRSLTVSVGHEHRQHLASGTWPHAQNIT